ncbi:MAG: MFS transporter, partial [Candidatus Bathyarchaeia archaeon]
MPPARYRVLSLCSLVHSSNHSFWVVVPVVMPLLIKDFQISIAEAGFLVSVFFITYALSQLPFGSFADRVDRRWLIGIGLGVMSIGMVLSGLAPNFWWLLLFQGIAGIGGGTFHPTSLALISDNFPVRERGRALGIHGVAASVAFFVTPWVMVYFLELGWRTPFLILGAFGIIIAVGFTALVGPQRSLTTPKLNRQPESWINRRLAFVTGASAL